MGQLGKGHDHTIKTLSSLTSSPISLYLPLMQYAFFFLYNYTFSPHHLLQAFVFLCKVDVM